MKNRIFWLLSLTFSMAVFAAIEDVVPTEQWLLETLAWASTAKGLSSLALVAGGAQVAMRFFQTPLANFTGKMKLVAVALFNLIGVVAIGMSSGLSVLGVILSAVGLTAVQVLVHQVYVQFLQKAD